jgi:predicted AAA+ superfamily ATPase
MKPANMPLFTQLISDSSERFQRDLLPRATKISFASNKILVLIGMRRVGKTCLGLQTVHSLKGKEFPPEAILTLNLEDDRLPSGMNAADLGQLVDQFYQLYPENFNRKTVLFLDEVQNVTGWETAVRRFQDTLNCHILVTGSSAKLLSQEIATALRGRSLSQVVWPLSFVEFLSFRGESLSLKLPLSSKRKAFLRKHLAEYLTTGGFPEVVLSKDLLRREILKDYRDVMLFRDLIERHGVQNTVAIRSLLVFLLSNSGGKLSISKLSRDFESRGISVNRGTLYEYTEYIQDAYGAFLVPLFATSLRKQNVNPRKIYAIDTGMAVSLSHSLEPNYGAIFETLVYLDLRRAKYELTYYVTREGHEVDFLAQKVGSPSLLVQVCWSFDSEATAEREMRALQSGKRETKAKAVFVTPDTYLEFIEMLS